ncbi:MAG: Ser-Thr-rich GPI-anchored membrane family protein [Cyanobacteriota bacterium]|nr:Ser-Thr-rich GPI-anchored membrane family protein [Cyanobacteriota bacterium]
MDNIFGEASSKFGQKFSDPMLAGIDGAKISDELRSPSGIESSAESSEVKIENLNTGNDELLLSQNSLGTLGLSESQELREKTSIEEEDPLIGRGDNVGEKVDPLTGGESNEIETKTRTAQRRDRAGNSRGKAYNFGVLKDDEKLQEFVGKSDKRDFYKFRVKEKTDVDIELRGLSGNADLYLLNNKGKVIKKSTKGGKNAEDIERTLNPGNYYVRVQPKGNANANYTLSLDGELPDMAGNSLKKAHNLGVLKDDEKLQEFVGKSDKRDFYKFRVKEKTDVDIELRGLSGNADLYLLNNKGKVIKKSTKGGKNAEDIERTLNPGNYYVRVQSKGNANADYNLSLGTNSPHFHVDEPIIINIVDTAADAPTSLDDSSTIDLMVAYTPEARQAEGGTNAMKDLIEFAVDDANEAFAKSGVKSQLRLVHTAEVNYTESGKSRTELFRLQNPSDGYMDEVHDLRDDYGADIVSLFVGGLDDAGGVGYVMGTPAYGFESHAFNVVTNYNARNRHTLAHEIGHNLGLKHDRDNANGQGAFPYGYGYTTPSGAGTIMSYARNRLPYFSNPAISYNGEALGRTNFENSALAINKVAEYAANWRQSVDSTAKPKDSITVNSPNGGNTLEPGESYTITWNDNIDENVKLELYKGGSLSSTIASSTPSDGSYSWAVPETITSGGDYKVKITSFSDSSVSDLSDSNFTIEPDEEVNITSPTSSTSLEPGELHTIRWTDNFSDRIRLELYKGSSFQQTISSSTPSDGSYSWTVPTSLSSASNYNIKIRNVNDSSVYDYSSNFTIESQTGGSSNPDIDIQLYYSNEEFTSYQKSIIEQAAQNWERIITQDKDNSGILPISVAEGSTDINGESWGTSLVQATQERGQNPPWIIGGIRVSKIKFNSSLDNWSDRMLVNVAMYGIGVTLGLEHEEGNPNSLMSYTIGESERILTTETYNNLEEMGYEFDRNATIYES